MLAIFLNEMVKAVGLEWGVKLIHPRILNQSKIEKNYTTAAHDLIRESWKWRISYSVLIILQDSSITSWWSSIFENFDCKEIFLFFCCECEIFHGDIKFFTAFFTIAHGLVEKPLGFDWHVFESSKHLRLLITLWTPSAFWKFRYFFEGCWFCFVVNVKIFLRYYICVYENLKPLI